MDDESRHRFAARIAEQPILQAGIIFVLGVLMSLLDLATRASGISSSEKNTPWILMTACILFYAVCSSVLSLRARNQNTYWRNSILSFVGLMILSGLFAMLISGLSMDKAGSFRWLFFVMAIGYLVFLSIVRLIRRIVELAIKQDEKLRGGE